LTVSDCRIAGIIVPTSFPAASNNALQSLVRSSNPTLILADEPTGALDSKTSDEIISLFGELNKEGRAIVVVTHAADVAKRARRQITPHDGRVVADDANSLDSFRLTVVNSERPR
jgi:ABC-type multidrug transport system ATPase subunit